MAILRKIALTERSSIGGFFHDADLVVCGGKSVRELTRTATRCDKSRVNMSISIPMRLKNQGKTSEN
jgi:hypothetical protein